MTKKAFAALAALMMLALVPVALSHTGNGAAATTEVGPNHVCWSSQNPHDYGGSGGIVVGAQSIGTWHIGAQASGDGAVPDCDLDGQFPGTDHDYEYSVSGGFFPAGIWASDPTCDYGFRLHHGPNFHVHSDIPDEGAGYLASFTVGSDPTPPTLVPTTDLSDDDGFDCVTDGGVTPDLDLDDCLESFAHTGTTTCLPGGDGGRWVWTDCVVVVEGDDVGLGLTDVDGDGIPDGTNPQISSLPSGVLVSCENQGHIWSS